MARRVEIRPVGPGYVAADQRTPQRVDVTRAHQQAEISLAEGGVEEAAGIVKPRKPGHRLAAAGVGGGLGHEQALHAGEVLGSLTGRIHRQDAGDIGGGERSTETAGQRSGA